MAIIPLPDFMSLYGCLNVLAYYPKTGAKGDAGIQVYI
jgi:hypothetical protein